jgi:putative addiction module antidote
MVTTKVRKVGSSLGVILARPTVEALGVSDGDELVISEARGRLSMRKLSPSSRPFMAALQKLVRKHRAVLSRLDD